MSRFSRELYNACFGRDHDRVRTLGERVDTLFDAIAHGDEAHRQWLYAAIVNHLAGRPVQIEDVEPRNSGA